MFNFLLVAAGSFVAEHHIARVEFKGDTAIVHTTTDNITVVDAKAIAELKEFVGVEPPPPAPAPDPPADPAGPVLVPVKPPPPPPPPPAQVKQPVEEEVHEPA
jgi:outer membrane biosynthesis protein TonB